MNLMLRLLDLDLAVCKIRDLQNVDLKEGFFSVTRTEQETSLICESKRIPHDCIRAEKGFRAFQIMGKLDFSLIGVVAGITSALTKNKISVFVLSTYDTDYILVKDCKVEQAIDALIGAGYSVVQ